jgi:transposase-like protein
MCAVMIGKSLRGRKSEEIIALLGQADASLSEGQSVGEVCRSLGIAEHSYHRWRAEYGGMKLEQVKRLKKLENENARLRQAVADLTLEKLALKEAAERNC